MLQKDFKSWKLQFFIFYTMMEVLLNWFWNFSLFLLFEAGNWYIVRFIQENPLKDLFCILRTENCQHDSCPNIPNTSNVRRREWKWSQCVHGSGLSCWLAEKFWKGRRLLVCSTLLHYISFEIWVVKYIWSIQIPKGHYRDHLVNQLNSLYDTFFKMSSEALRTWCGG